MVIEVLDAAGTERNQSLSTLGVFLGGDIGKSSVHMILSVSCGTCCNYGTGYQECASALIHGLIGLNGTILSVADRLELYCSLLTGLYAVKAIYTAAIVYLVVLGVYTSGLAASSALATVNALILINLKAEN